MNSNTKDLIMGSIEDLIEKISDDKLRLKSIINSINNNNNKHNINDKLINNLDDLVFEDVNLQNAIEYLTLIFSNTETQKITTDKIHNAEMIKILDHILTSIKHVSSVVKSVDDDTVKNNTIPHTPENTDHDKPKKNIFKDTILPSITPNNKISNILLWLAIFMVIMSLLYILDKDALSEGEHILHNATTSTVKRGFLK